MASCTLLLYSSPIPSCLRQPFEVFRIVHDKTLVMLATCKVHATFLLNIGLCSPIASFHLRSHPILCYDNGNDCVSRKLPTLIPHLVLKKPGPPEPPNSTPLTSLLYIALPALLLQAATPQIPRPMMMLTMMAVTPFRSLCCRCSCSCNCSCT